MWRAVLIVFGIGFCPAQGVAQTDSEVGGSTSLSACNKKGLKGVDAARKAIRDEMQSGRQPTSQSQTGVTPRRRTNYKSIMGFMLEVARAAKATEERGFKSILGGTPLARAQNNIEQGIGNLASCHKQVLETLTILAAQRQAAATGKPFEINEETNNYIDPGFIPFQPPTGTPY